MVGFFLVICFSGGEVINLTVIFIAYELFDECDMISKDFNLPEGVVLIFTVAIFLVRNRGSSPQLCMRRSFTCSSYPAYMRTCSFARVRPYQIQ